MADDSQKARKHTPFDQIYNWVAFKKYPKHVKGQGQKANFKRLCKNFRVIDSKLYYIRNGRGDPDLELFVLSSKDEVHHVIKAVHERGGLEDQCDEIIGHCAKDRMLKYISQRFFWRTVVKDVMQYVNSCQLCKDKEPKGKFRLDSIGIETTSDLENLNPGPKTRASYMPWNIKDIAGTSSVQLKPEIAVNMDCSSVCDTSVREEVRPPQKTILTAEEEIQLKSTILALREQQVELTRETICKMAYDIVEKSGRSHPFRNNQAGREWFINFMDRHSLTIESSKRLSYSSTSSVASLDSQKKLKLDSNSQIKKCFNSTVQNSNLVLQKSMIPFGISVTEELKPMLNDVFSKYEQVLNQTQLIEHPSSIYCASELFFSVNNDNGNPYVTIFACANAAGQSLPPMIIFHDNNKEYPTGTPSDTFFLNSATAFDAILFHKWFLRFLSWVPPIRPIILIVGGNPSLITEKVTAISYIEEVKIVTIPLPVSQSLHPLQVSVFPSLNKRFYEEMQYVDNNKPLTHFNFCQSFTSAWFEASSPSKIKSGFQMTGIFPFSPIGMQSSMPANFYKNSIMTAQNCSNINNSTVTTNHQQTVNKRMIDNIMQACKRFRSNPSDGKDIESKGILADDESMENNDDICNDDEIQNGSVISEDFCNNCRKYFYNDQNQESWIQCFQCRKWNHCRCENIPEYNIPSVFVCSKCTS